MAHVQPINAKTVQSEVRGVPVAHVEAPALTDAEFDEMQEWERLARLSQKPALDRFMSMGWGLLQFAGELLLLAIVIRFVMDRMRTQTTSSKLRIIYPEKKEDPSANIFEKFIQALAPSQDQKNQGEGEDGGVEASTDTTPVTFEDEGPVDGARQARPDMGAADDGDGGEKIDAESADEDSDDEGEDSDDVTVIEATRLADVAGMSEAKREVTEIIDFLVNPEVYTKLGAKMPRGVLLSGPPGCGKTLLARALASEAGLPLILCSGSEFVEMYVGVGASRVREVFKEAKKIAPCIIFIDEIDSIGRARGGSANQASAEQDQTINQLLTEMDGFEKRTGILVIAATNRPDILDEALTRPGRFDRQITITPPTAEGRQEILEVHLRDKPLATDVSTEQLARITRSFSGAELANLCNEAAIHAARKRLDAITRECFDEALEKLLLGLETNAVYTEEQRRLIAYHEAGHALLGILVEEYDTVKKVCIVPRGSAGGVTLFEPPEAYETLALYSQQYLENQMVVALGGRVAEELIFGRMKTTVGAVSDFQKVQSIARSMVTKFGFNQNMGQAAWSDETSPSTANEIDSEVKFLVDWAYKRATDLIATNESYLHRIAKRLLEKESIDTDELCEAVEGMVCTLQRSKAHK